MKLKKYKLYEIADLNTSSISNSDNTLSEIIYLDTSSITENVILSTYKVSIHEAPSRAQRRVKKNTILYSTVRPRLKHYGILSSPEANLIVSTGFVTIDVKSEFQDSVDARFLFLLLTQPHITEYIASIADSAVSAYPSFNPSDISALEFEFPEMNIQTHIADIWEYYDSKIGLNRQINDNLEAMAKQLYDYWFVQFDFPNEEGKPYKTSGGEMVWNEKLKREIPKGWKSTTLGDECQMYQPKTLGLSELDESAIYKVYGANGVVGKYHTYNHENSEIAMACRGNSCGTINRTAPFSWITGNAMVIKMIDDSIHNEYIKQALRYANVNGAISGSGQPQLTRENLSSIKLCKPTRKLIMRFSEQVSNIVEMYLQNEANIEELTKQRDDLLPLLMNGQATVNYHLSDD